MGAIGRVERTTTCPSSVSLPLYSTRLIGRHKMNIKHYSFDKYTRPFRHKNVLDIEQQKQQRVSRAVERILRLVCSKHLTEVMNEIPTASSPTSSSAPPPESEKLAAKRSASNTNSDEQSDCELV
ncbi:unnamed protein product [Cercopithifilaria johnstoni]|uniref:Uncharacterized protein n=1 Tax=Cercopithifilaria johnstoni TaxID=2874296 RepID=A0A8J2Q9H7_9BILA|nr:unnamed protein product [Cercopithifilaria johnstoni]